MNSDLENQLLETQALNLYNQKSFNLATLKLQRMLHNQSPKKSQIYDWLANSFIAKGEPLYKVDQKHKKALLFNDPNYPFIYVSLAAFLLQQTKFKEARIEIENFLLRERSNPRGLHLRAKIYFHLGLHGEADHTYLTLFCRDSRFSGLYDGWACNDYYQGKFDSAKEKLLKGLELDPESSEAFRMLGYLLLDEQKYQEAIDHFQKAVDIQPLESATWINWSVALMVQNEEEEAKVKFEKGCELLERDTRFNKKEEMLQVLKADFGFKQQYIETGKDEQRRIALKANLEGLKKVISLLEQDIIQKNIPL